MIKVKCTNCGKSYNYSLYSGVCPKCHSVYRIQNTTAPFSMPGDIPKPVPKGKGEQRTENKLYEPVKITLMVMITIGLLLVIAYPIYIDKVGDNKGKIVEAVKEKELKLGDEIIYSSDQTYHLAITDVTVEKNTWSHISKEYEPVSVSYRLEGEESPVDKFDSKLMIQPYLITKSGEYLPPVSTWEIQQRTGYTDERLDKEYIDNKITNSKGKLYFLVKKNDIKGLLVNCFNYKYGDFHEAYVISNLEVKHK